MTVKFILFQKNDYWSLKPSKDINLYKKPSKKTIFLGKEPQKSFDLFDKFIKKRKIENYYPFPIRLREKELLKYLKYVTKIKKVEEKFGKKQLIKNKNKFILGVGFAPFIPAKIFFFYLTKKQIKNIKKEKKKTK